MPAPLQRSTIGIPSMPAPRYPRKHGLCKSGLLPGLQQTRVKNRQEKGNYQQPRHDPVNHNPLPSPISHPSVVKPTDRRVDRVRLIHLARTRADLRGVRGPSVVDGWRRPDRVLGTIVERGTPGRLGSGLGVLDAVVDATLRDNASLRLACFG
jgi:hypothetical protein